MVLWLTQRLLNRLYPMFVIGWKHKAHFPRPCSAYTTALRNRQRNLHYSKAKSLRYNTLAKPITCNHQSCWYMG